jgi:DNA-directed RNA polymerase subunit K/omega
MADRTDLPNAFEFVVVAGARARQLLRGCTPKTTGSDKLVRLAQKEVREGKVVNTGQAPIGHRKPEV